MPYLRRSSHVSFAGILARLRDEHSFASIAEATVAELASVIGVRGAAVVGCDRTGTPASWTGSAFFDAAFAGAYVAARHTLDPCLAYLRRTHAPALLSRFAVDATALAVLWGHADPRCDLWCLPITGRDGLAGMVRVAVDHGDDPRWSALPVVGSYVSMRLALLGGYEPLSASAAW